MRFLAVVVLLVGARFIALVAAAAIKMLIVICCLYLVHISLGADPKYCIVNITLTTVWFA